MRPEDVTYADLPALAAASRAAGQRFRDALGVASHPARAGKVLARLDALSGHLHDLMMAEHAVVVNRLYAHVWRAARAAAGTGLLVVLPVGVLVAAGSSPRLILAVPGLLGIPLVVWIGVLVWAEVRCWSSWRRMARMFDEAFDVLDAAVLAGDPAACPLGTHDVLLGPWRATFGAGAPLARAA